MTTKVKLTKAICFYFEKAVLLLFKKLLIRYYKNYRSSDSLVLPEVTIEKVEEQMKANRICYILNRNA